MIKGYGNIQCVNDGRTIHIIEGDNGKGLCGNALYTLKRDYYGRKNNIIWRNLDAITCEICKELYKHN